MQLPPDIQEYWDFAPQVNDLRSMEYLQQLRYNKNPWALLPLVSDFKEDPDLKIIPSSVMRDYNKTIQQDYSGNLEYLHLLLYGQNSWAPPAPVVDHDMEPISSSMMPDCSETVQQDDSWNKELLGSNSCNNQGDLYTSQCKFEQSRYCLGPYMPVESTHPVGVFKLPEQPSPIVKEECNDGCTYEELLEILNSGDKPVNNPSPKIEKSFSRSSSTNHKPKDMKQKRRRRPSVKFSDLIKKKKLLLGDKVYYRKKNRIELGAGIVKETGIQCCCCGNVYSMSKFEKHTVLKVNGKLSHRAPTHIYLGNGSSLEKLQLEILQDHSD